MPHLLTGKTDLTSHSLDTNQMIELAEADEIVPCASCAFKQAEDRREFKRKRLRSGNKRRAKRQKMVCGCGWINNMYVCSIRGDVEAIYQGVDFMV